jgi:hypothetical protein
MKNAMQSALDHYERNLKSAKNVQKKELQLLEDAIELE